MAPTLASTTSRHAHLSPALLWSLVAIILVNALLLIIWLVHCRRTAARARKIISVDLPETKTTTSASDPRSNWSWIRNPRLWKNHRGGDNQGLTGDKAGTNVSSDTTASTEDLEAGMRVIVIQPEPVIIREKNSELGPVPAWQRSLLEAPLSMPGTPALTIGTSCRSTPEPEHLQDAVSTCSIYSQASWPGDFSAFLRFDPTVDGADLTKKLNVDANLDEDPDILPTMSSAGSLGFGLTSELFLESDPEPAFELAAAALASSSLGLDKLAGHLPAPSVSNSAHRSPPLPPPRVLQLRKAPSPESSWLTIPEDTRRVVADVPVDAKIRSLASSPLPSPCPVRKSSGAFLLTAPRRSELGFGRRGGLGLGGYF